MKVKSIAVLIASFVVLPLLSMTVLAAPYGEGTYGNCDYGSVNGCDISITTTGSVDLAVTPVVGGNTTIGDDVVEVSTNSLSGYTLTMSNSSATEDSLVSGTNTIGAVGGTDVSPSVLALNSWGFRIDDFSGFGAGPTVEATNQASSTLTFGAVPLSGSPLDIRVNTSGAVSGETTTIWYGVRADNSQPSGTYTATITYTATANP